MGKGLVLAEKPSVGRDLARVLKCHQKGKGYLEGDKYIVTWALGHLVTLADPEAYDQKYKTWAMETLPMLPSRLKLVVIKESGGQFNNVKKLLNRKDVKEIIIATDAGREGELVARWIIEKARVKKPLKRLWISSVTDKAIKEGFNNLKDGREYESLYASAAARSEADWLVGINATRALTCKYNAQLSCGRVQTPTLAIIAKREEEINNFRPKDFYGINAQTVDYNLKLIWQEGPSKGGRVFNKDKCDEIINRLQEIRKAKVSGVKRAQKDKIAPPLYDLTQLQREANKLYGLSARETSVLAQRLYENHKVITYPRTDSRHITSDMVDTLKDRVKAFGHGPYASLASKILKGPIKTSKSFVDDGKVSDHHAIIPTEEKVVFSNLNEGERKVFDLVARRFLAVLFPPFKYEQTTLEVKIEEETFMARGKRVISPGWKEVYGSNMEEAEGEGDPGEEPGEQILPRVNQGDILEIARIYQTAGKTSPPAAFDEGTLLSAMENPSRYMPEENKDFNRTLGETGGLGTVATRADIIEKLFNSFLIEKKGKHIYLTSKGQQLLELVPEDLKSPALTAQWEQKLSAIARGSLKKEAFVNEMRDYALVVVNDIKESKETFKHDNLTGNRCPECNKYMLEVKGKKGKMLVCQDRECGFKKGIAKETNARCPECRKKLELRGEGEGQIFVCKCGFREKLSAFNNRKKGEGRSISRKEASKYLNQQKKADEPINSALADALSQLKNQK